jgi:hypothetical protein
MPWPASIGVLLAMPESRSAQALRWGLRGLRASLQAALDEVPDSPGCAELRDLLGELEPLLAGGPGGSVLPPEDPDALPLDSAAAPRLLSLAQAAAEDARFPEDARRALVGCQSDADLWNAFHRLMLRLPPGLTGDWRDRCVSEAQRLGCRLDDSAAAVLPLSRDEIIYPGLTGAVEAAGLRAAAGAPLDPRLGKLSEPDLRFLAGLVATWLWFIEHDDGLCHCLKSVFRFGVTPLRGEQRDRYTAELLRRWERVRAAGAGPAGSRAELKERLQAHLDLDEALHTLVYQPPAAADSWWGRLLAEARDVLFRVRDTAAEAGCPVHFQLLAGTFADVSHLAPDSLQVDFGAPGEVALCVRIWARVDGEEQKGRVLYRSPEDEV